MIDLLKNFTVIPVLVLDDVDTGLKMCECLCENNLPVAEITFRTAAAPTIIREAARRFPQMLLGAGTVLQQEHLNRAIDAGAKFAVAPGFNPGIVRTAMAHQLPFAPGVCTPI